MKKTVSILLSFLLLFGLFGAALPAYAEGEPEIVASGTVGTTLTWTLDSEGVLTVSGTGAIPNYKDWKNSHNAPWASFRSNILSLVIEDGVNCIGNYSFSYCRNLTNVTVAGSVKRIGKDAFYECTSITDLTIEDGVETIDTYAFYFCNSLSTVFLPKSVTTLTGDSFPKNLREITVDAENPALYVDAFGCLYNAAEATCVKMPNIGNELTAYTVPEGITAVSSYAFYNCAALQSVTLPQTLTEIGFAAFSDCPALTGIDLPAGLTELGSNAFENCTSLTHAQIPGGVSVIGGYAFKNCTALSDVTISYGVTRIGRDAFYNCNSLTGISIPESVTFIGDGAFYDSGLQEAYIPDSLTQLGSNVFYSTPWFEAMPDGVVYAGKFAWHYKGAITDQPLDIVLREDCTGIADGAFYNRTDIASIVIPDSLTYIGEEAFWCCTNLQTIYLGSGVKNIRSSIFGGCIALTDIYYNECEGHWNLVTIDYWWNEPLQNATVHCNDTCADPVIAEGYCGGEGDGTNLSYTLDINGLLTVSGSGAMTDVCPWAYQMNHIKNVNIEPGVTTIGRSAFMGANLTDVVLPSGITSIGTFAFVCRINSLTIPESLTEVCYYAFQEGSLSTVYYEGSEAQWAQIAIADMNGPLSYATIYYNVHDHVPASPVRENETAATCTAGGSYEEVVYCAKCDHEFSRTEITVNPTGHNWGEWEVVKQATLEETGILRRVCRNDPSHVEEETIPRLELDDNGKPTNTITEFVDRISSHFKGLIDWFLRLFRRP